MTKRMIHNADDLERVILDLGFLPFFKNSIEGFSVEDLTSPELWFEDGVDGPWEWKGPVIRNGKCPYGKFFGDRAGFVSLEWFPDFEYQYDKQGRSYGWGVARYTTPEALFGDKIALLNHTPEKSKVRILRHLG